MFVDFDGRIVKYEREEMNEITLAYAISVHKSQGSEYKAVVMPLMTQHFIMLQRNLFYTALTRAKKLCVIVGTYSSIGIATPLLYRPQLLSNVITVLVCLALIGLIFAQVGHMTARWVLIILVALVCVGMLARGRGAGALAGAGRPAPA